MTALASSGVQTGRPKIFSSVPSDRHVKYSFDAGFLHCIRPVADDRAAAGLLGPTRFVLASVAQDFRRLSFTIRLEKIYASKSLIRSITRDVSLFAHSDLEVAAGIDRYNQMIGHRVWRGSARRP
jgi:hypothetical protein